MTKHKCTFKSSMFGSVQETVITDTGTSQTLQANLSKVHADRKAGISIATKQLLAKAAIHANDYSNDASADFGAFNSNAEPVESDASVDDGVDEGSDICVPVTGDEHHAVSAVRTHVFACIRDYVHVWSVDQCDDELANVSLIRAGYLGGSPVQPMLAVSLECLELYHQIHQRKVSFSVQAMVKVLCALHSEINQSMTKI
ncbi:hypothetical protein BD769DRAFT_1386566 [Suillus cothurnatus]|nr:hypothetical protein BD769DRAFT_1386566 [Suillus cothurnatus]